MQKKKNVRLRCRQIGEEMWSNFFHVRVTWNASTSFPLIRLMVNSFKIEMQEHSVDIYNTNHRELFMNCDGVILREKWYKKRQQKDRWLVRSLCKFIWFIGLSVGWLK